MKVILFAISLILGGMILAAGCTQQSTGSGPAPLPAAAGTTPAVTTSPALANPAAVFCEGKNYKSVIRRNPDGSEYGVCIFPSGNECDEWAFYQGTCNETTGK